MKAPERNAPDIILYIYMVHLYSKEFFFLTKLFLFRLRKEVDSAALKRHLIVTAKCAMAEKSHFCLSGVFKKQTKN
jgi:hypothetical protein